MRSTIRCAVCASCLTLLASPDSAGGGLGRARVVSLRGVLFSFFGQNNDLKSVRTCNIFHRECEYVRNRVDKQVDI